MYDLDGNSFTADNDGEGSEHEDGEAYAIYNDDKQSLLVRLKIFLCNFLEIGAKVNIQICWNTHKKEKSLQQGGEMFSSFHFNERKIDSGLTSL